MKQDEKRENIEKLKSQIVNLESLRNSGLSNVSKKDVTDLKSQLKKEQQQLDRLIQLRNSQQKFREKKKRLLQSVCDKDETISKALKTVNREHPGRPRIDIGQSNF